MGGRLFEAGCLLTFLTYRVGAYLRWALFRGWALNRINTVSKKNIYILFINYAIFIVKTASGSAVMAVHVLS